MRYERNNFRTKDILCNNGTEKHTINYYTYNVNVYSRQNYKWVFIDTYSVEEF